MRLSLNTANPASIDNALPNTEPNSSMELLHQLAENLLRKPISNDPNHPVNQPDRTIYFPRTNNLAAGDTVFSSAVQRQNLTSALLNAGTSGRVSVEVQGSYGRYDGAALALLNQKSSIVAGKPTLAGVLEAIPPNKRPKLEFLISGARPTTDSLFGQETRKVPNAMLGVTHDQNVDRYAANWGNSSIFNTYLNEVTDIVKQVKARGLQPNMVLDDHFGVPPLMMENFKKLNGLPPGARGDLPAQRIVTGRIGQIADAAHADGGLFTLSLVGPPPDARKFGVNPYLIGEKIDVLEMQIYRESPQSVKNNLDIALNDMRGHLKELPNLKEVRIALTTKANGHSLTEAELIGQQKEINSFRINLTKLYQSQGLTPPKVTTSLWENSNFYK
jgi:hypothetical protein